MIHPLTGMVLTSCHRPLITDHRPLLYYFFTMTQRAALKAIKSFLPENKLTNEQLAEQFGDWHASQILSKTGVATRGVAGPDECASDLGVKAAQRLFESGACTPEEIDFLIFCTQSPDYFTPTTACVMQNALGLPTSCGAVDINQGCSGYIYGLALAKSLVEAGTARTVLLVTALSLPRDPLNQLSPSRIISQPGEIRVVLKHRFVFIP